MTLDRVISRFGLASRSVAAEWIESGRVSVNGKIERNRERWIRVKVDRVSIDQQEISEATKLYVMLNKPTDVVTSFGDPQGRETVYDYLQDLKGWVFPVGRLDKDTSGLLLLSNNTEFGNRLTDPQSKVIKKYIVKVNAILSAEELNRLRRGIEIEPGLITMPCGIQPLRQSEKYLWFEVSLVEGRNRQIRRMVEALGHKVIKLVRVQIGALRLGELGVGKWRMLTRAEVKALAGRRSSE